MLAHKQEICIVIGKGIFLGGGGIGHSFLNLDFLQKLMNLKVEKSTLFSFSTTILKEIVISFELCKS